MDRSEAAELIERHGGLKAASEATGIPRSTLWSRAGGSGREDRPEDRPADAKESIRESGDELTVECITDHLIHSEEELVRKFKIDLTKWYIHQFKCSAWGVPMRLRQGQDESRRSLPDKPVAIQNYYCSATFRRALPKPIEKAHDALFERMRRHSPRYGRPPASRVVGRPCMLEVDLFDVHFGKYAWEPETGQNYDLSIADRVYRNAVDDLLAKAAGFNAGIERCVLPIGNDFFHIDNLVNATTRGTPQDVDGRYAKIIETGEAAVIWAVERLAEVAPVTVLRVPGNHDRQTSHHLARTVEVWFRHHKNVTVDNSPRQRKYVRYGANLIGYTHGDEEKPDLLPTVMSTEVDPAEMVGVKYREWHLGHYHKAKELRYVGTDTVAGTVIRHLESLSGTDAYHYRKAYVSNRRSAQAFIWDRGGGCDGPIHADARIN